MNLKSKTGDFNSLKFAYLIEPNTPVRNDKELYDAVRKHGRAVIRQFDGASLRLLAIESLTPVAFESAWRGD